ncbi:hypothetical protein L2E82_41670 [Cichorium intybus]|uniref:Uncharacterized protein n=1 Tax=Cichorium intybus TaxID=13427 RepID=A0ACB8ZL99_CICIN|nr:hypothetical protein L2E82_41670 [Cichorium intybus]
MCTFPISDKSLLRRDLNETFSALSFDRFFVDCCCTIRIIDESNPSSGISINVFAETFEKHPHVESTGDIIQFSQVVIKAHGSEVNTVFNKKYSSFALYEGKESSNFVLHPTPNTSELTA